MKIRQIFLQSSPDFRQKYKLTDKLNNSGEYKVTWKTYNQGKLIVVPPKTNWLDPQCNRDTLKGNNGDYKQTSNRPDLLDTGGARSNFHLLDTGQMFTMKTIEPGLSSLLHNKIHNLHNLIVTTIRSGDVRRNNENIKERWGFSWNHWVCQM